MISNRHHSFHFKSLSLSESRVFSKPASQDFPYKEMEEELTCPVCLELYADPLMLPCSHSICKACLHDIMASRVKAEKQGLVCPSCRQNHYLTADQVMKFPKNLSLENIVFRYQEMCSFSLSKVAQLDSPECSTNSKSSVAKSGQYDANCLAFEESRDTFDCGLCEKPGQQAEWFCQQCQVFYCQLCLYTFHPKRGSLSKHKVRKPTLKESVDCMLHCPDHNSESANIFCDTCKVVACHLCVCRGPGSHCGHVILDLETARKQLQEALHAAKNQLSTLITSFTGKSSVIDTHIKEMKDFEDSVKKTISGQYNCILSDIAATLSLVKRKSLESIGAVANQYSSHLAAQNLEAKAVLQQCQNLGAVCDNLLSSVEDTSDIVCDDSFLFVQHLPSVISSDILCASDSTGAENVSSVDDASDSESNVSKFNLLNKIAIKQSEPPTTSADNRCQGNTLLSEVQLPAHLQKVDISQMQNEIGCINRLASNLTDNRKSQFLAEKFSQKTKDFMTFNIRTKVPCSKNKTVEKVESFDKPEENYEDLNSTKYMMPDVSDLNSTKHLMPDVSDLKIREPLRASYWKEYDKHQSCTETEKTSLLTPVHSSLVKKIVGGEQLLLRAVEVGPVLKQVSALIKQSDCPNCVETDNAVLHSNDQDNSALTQASDFHTACLVLLSNITDQFSSNCAVITPAIRSGVTPLGLSQSALPLSRTLITWGFNSTTFTADPVNSSTQWSVNVDRNSNHIGDIKTGYLFGIGVSTKPLGSKEQVGMTADSHAIACIGGQLVFCQDSTQNVVMSLNDLPISANISVTSSKCGLVMAYKLRLTGLSSAVCGRRIIVLNTQSGFSNENDTVEMNIFPVFTASQRVKLHFPVTSDV